MAKEKIREVYLDNAATTKLDPNVLQAMLPYMENLYGNPSSTHILGNKAKVAIEDVRRSVMEGIGAHGGSVFFTSSGTEANNWAITGTVEAYGIQDIITSPIEHESVLKCIQQLTQTQGVTCHYVNLSEKGEVDYTSLTALLEKHPKALVSLMHGNNEIGNLTDLHLVGSLCKKYNAIFHTDLVQTLGYYNIRAKDLAIDLCTGSAHKLHGPKGTGFVYINHRIQPKSLLYGGMQERGMRAGTENVAGIVGLGKSLEIAIKNREQHFVYLQSIKNHMIQEIQQNIPNTQFHGLCQHPTKSLCHLLSINLPFQHIDNEVLTLKLSIQGISASRGSACMSGASTQSHVLNAINIPTKNNTLRFSFSKYTTYEDIAYTVKKLLAV